MSKAKEHLKQDENVDDVTTKHAQEFADMRGMLGDDLEEKDDVVLYRFLRGYQFNVKKAVAALEKSLRWRQAHKMDDYRDKAKDLVQEQFPNADLLETCYPHRIYHGLDKRGQPISVERLGRTNPDLFVKTVTIEQLLEYHFYHMENKAALVSKLTREKGTIIRTCKIMDLEGLGYSHLHRKGLKYLKTIITLSQDNYPEMLGNLYVINAPWAFETAWRIIKPWLNPATLEKISILGKDYQKVLLENIEPENLPDFCGGTCSSCKRGCVPETTSAPDLTQKVDIPARHHKTVEVRLQKSETIEYKYLVVKRDVGVEVTFESPDLEDEPDGRIVVKEYEKIKESIAPHIGSYTAPCSGIFALKFDNSYSYWNGKVVRYMTEKSADELPSINSEISVFECD